MAVVSHSRCGRTDAAASERWIDTPLKPQDHSHLDLDATPDGEPASYYQTMFDLVALAFDADITRSVSFMLSREDGMGISDTFPLKLGLPQTHHNLSHAGDREGTLLDNTLVLYGSGCSTTHWPKDLPTLVAGGVGWGCRMAATCAMGSSGWPTST